jgi:hypothetical protein
MRRNKVASLFAINRLSALALSTLVTNDHLCTIAPASKARLNGAVHGYFAAVKPETNEWENCARISSYVSRAARDWILESIELRGRFREALHLTIRDILAPGAMPPLLYKKQQQQQQQEGEAQVTRPKKRMSGSSQIACEFIDELARELNVSIMHKHCERKNNDLVVSGQEFRIPDTLYHADGFIPTEAALSIKMEGSPSKFNAGKGLVIEYHGQRYHGCPEDEHNTQSNYLGLRYCDLYKNTMERMRKISALGYCVFFIWEYQYREYKRQKHQLKGKSLMSFGQMMPMLF